MTPSDDEVDTRDALPVFRPRRTLTLREEYRDQLDAMEERLGHRFGDRRHLQEALLHPSMREKEHASYERLEFLGDAVLGMVIAEDLFHRFPDSDEGQLTKVKSAVVSRAALAKVGRGLGLEDCLILGKGMTTHETVPRSVIANATESLIGALYLDAGLEVARRFVMNQLDERIRQAVRRRHAINHKSLLQQLTQKHGRGVPTYELLQIEGPDHQRRFEVRAVVEDRPFAAGHGASKKSAEQRAARNALRVLEMELDERPSRSTP